MPNTFRPLRTAEDMYDYCETYDLGLTNSKKSILNALNLFDHIFLLAKQY